MRFQSKRVVDAERGAALVAEAVRAIALRHTDITKDQAAVCEACR